MRSRNVAVGGTQVLVAGLLVALGSPAPPAAADHPSMPMTTGIYRIPYADGVAIDVFQDNHSHGGDGGNKNRVDLGGDAAEEQIVAAATGVIKGVVDRHGDDDNNGDGLAADQTAHLPGFDDSDEHSCQDDTYQEGDVIPPGSSVGSRIPNSVVTGLCQQYNNYVWIEHPNGEWTKYTHFATGSVTALGWAVEMEVEAGDVLGTEGDVGFASGRHLHHEAAIPNNPGDDLTWGELGGFFNNGQNLALTVCDIGGNDTYDQPEDDFVANPCDHLPPTADAGGPYEVDEGSSVQFDGTGSNDPEGNPLTYAWTDGTNNPPALLDDASLPEPTYSAVDDELQVIQLDVYDQIEQLNAHDSTLLIVSNVAPTVTAVGDTIDEAGTATVSATFTDPGTQDTHTATIDWGDGSPLTLALIGQLSAGFDHVYGDNGTYPVTVTVTDDDGGVGSDTVDVVVGNLDPTVSLDTSDAVSFPGGDYLVVEDGSPLPASAEGTDPGSDDLTFSWSTGDASTYFNDGLGPDPLPSPFGTFPFAASDQIVALLAGPGVQQLAVDLTDDDDGSDSASAGVLVTGTADTTQGDGWWMHQYGGQGNPQLDDTTLAGYRDIVNAVSSVFAEQVPLGSAAEAHEVLSPAGDGFRGRAESALLAAWLQFASGAVAWDATVPLASGGSVAFLDLMFTAEAGLLDGGATNAELHTVELDLARVRHAG